MLAPLRRPLSSSSTASLRSLRALRQHNPHSLRFMTTTQYEFILTSRPAEGVGLITLNRPKALNALSTPLFVELNAAIQDFDNDDSIRALVLTGSERFFAGKFLLRSGRKAKTLTSAGQLVPTSRR